MAQYDNRDERYPKGKGSAQPTIAQVLRAWLLGPITTELTEMRKILLSKLDDLQAAAERTGAAVHDAVVLVPDLRSKIASLQQELATGQLDNERLSAITASLDATTDSLTQALNPVVEEPHVDTGDAEVQPETNPETVDPGSVDGSVPAGEPLQL